MSTPDLIPLSREYLKTLVDGANEEFLKPILLDFITQLRKNVIETATKGGVAIHYDFPERLEKQKDKLEEILRTNFPDCDIMLEMAGRKVYINWAHQY